MNNQIKSNNTNNTNSPLLSQQECVPQGKKDKIMKNVN